jgi:hypothetical protein
MGGHAADARAPSITTIPDRSPGKQMPGASCGLGAGLKETGTMINLTFSADTRNRNVGLGDEAGLTVLLLDSERLQRDRAWWAAEAERTGTDWRSLADAVLEALVSVGILRLEQSTFELACEQADRDQLPRPSRSGAAMAAPPTTIEALMFSLRRGVNELAQSDTLRRLSALDGDQVKQVCRRVQAFQPGIAEPWSTDEVDALISAWKKSR